MSRNFYRSRTSRACSLAAATTLLFAAFQSAQAQQDDSDSLQMEEILVTAQKRETTLLEVPAAITVLTGDVLAKQRILSNEDLVRLVPSMNFTSFGSASGESSLIMRGLATAYGLSPTVSFYVDETPMDLREDGNTSTGSIDFFDVERVEVLRGPQGTVFGASSLGGTVRVITNKPDPSGFASAYEASYQQVDGGGSGLSAKAMLNLPVSDNTAIRLVAGTQDFPGYLTRVRPTSYFGETATDPIASEDVGDATRLSLRATLAYTPNDSLTITPSLIYQQTEARGSLQSDLTRPEYVYAGDFNSRDDVDLTIGSLVIEKDFDRFKLTSSTSLLDKKSRSVDDFSDFMSFFSQVVFGPGRNGPPTPIYFTEDQSPVDYEQFSQEIRFSSTGDGPFSWIAGLYYNSTDTDSNQNIFSDFITEISEPVFGVTPPTDEFSVYRAPSSDTQIAAFFDATWDVTDKFTIQAGLRAYELEQDFEIIWTGLFAGDSAAKTTEKVDDVTPRLSLRYDFNEDVSVYGSLAEGFRAGGTNTAQGDVGEPCDFEAVYRPFYESDNVASREIGLKSFVADRRGTLNVSVFQTDWENIQSAVNDNCGTFNANFGEAEIQGFEIEGQMNFTDNFSAYFGYSNNDAEFTKFNAGFEGVGGFEVGQKLINVPETQYNLGIEVRFAALRNSEGFFRADYQYADDVRVSNNRPERVRPEFKNLNLAFGMNWNEFSAELFVNNATDELQIFGFSNRFGNAGFLRYTVGRPLNYGVTVRYTPE